MVRGAARKRELHGHGDAYRTTKSVRLHEHYEILLDRWNEKINLTSVELGEEMVIRHYCESLFFAAQLESRPGLDIDFGSGFGGRVSWNPDGYPAALLANNPSRIAPAQGGFFERVDPRSLPNVSVLAQTGGRSATGGFDTLGGVSRAVDSKEVVKNMPRLASKIGLMMGEDDFLCYSNPLKHIAWSEPVRLPWGDRQSCACYGVSRGMVPRGTLVL